MSNLNDPNQSFGREHKIVLKLTKFLKTEHYNVRLEVPNLGQSVDLAATRGRWITLIEVKIHDWRTAIKQCRAHEHVADFVCIAVGTKNISKEAVREIKKPGYGLIHYREKDGKDEFNWVLQPARNRLLWRPQRKKLSLALREIEYAD